MLHLNTGVILDIVSNDNKSYTSHIRHYCGFYKCPFAVITTMLSVYYGDNIISKRFYLEASRYINQVVAVIGSHHFCKLLHRLANPSLYSLYLEDSYFKLWKSKFPIFNCGCGGLNARSLRCIVSNDIISIINRNSSKWQSYDPLELSPIELHFQKCSLIIISINRLGLMMITYTRYYWNEIHQKRNQQVRNTGHIC